MTGPFFRTLFLTSYGRHNPGNGQYFEANHFPHVVAIDGGFKAWKDAGQPIAKD